MKGAYANRRSATSAGLGREIEAKLQSLDRGLLLADRIASSASAAASAALLRAQLKAGQHVLALGHARVVALAIGLPTVCVRRGIGDPGPFKLREAR